MRWAFFAAVILTALLICILEWPKLKHKPKKDKAAFFALLLLVSLLSLLDLPNTPGPTKALEFIYKPFRGLVEMS